MATLIVQNVPDPLYGKLKARAKRERWPVAKEVTHLLSAVLDTPSALSIMALQGLGKELWHNVAAASHVESERGAWD